MLEQPIHNPYKTSQNTSSKMCRRQLNKCLTCTVDTKFRSTNATKNKLNVNCGNQSCFLPQPLSILKMPTSQSKKAYKTDLVGDLTHLLQMKQQHQAKLKQAKEQKFLNKMKQQQLQKQQPAGQQHQQLKKQQKLQQLPKQQPKKEPQHTQQRQQPPVACVDVVVHWTRSERDKYSSIKLLAPW